MRYFFHIIEGSLEIADFEGSLLESDDDAQAEAIAITSELARNFPQRFQQASVLEVHSQDGRRIFAVPIRGSAHANLALQSVD